MGSDMKAENKRSKIYEAQERYVRKNRAEGATRVNVWVPDEESAKEIKAIAREMRRGKWFEA